MHIYGISSCFVVGDVDHHGSCQSMTIGVQHEPDRRPEESAGETSNLRCSASEILHWCTIRAESLSQGPRLERSGWGI